MMLLIVDNLSYRGSIPDSKTDQAAIAKSHAMVGMCKCTKQICSESKLCSGHCDRMMGVKTHWVTACSRCLCQLTCPSVL